MRGQPRGRGDVDNRATAAVADCRRAMLHAEHGARQIDRERAVPRLDRGIGNTLAGDRPGVVDQDMELAETPQRCRDDLLPGALVGDVLPHKQDLAALAAKTLGQALTGRGVDVGQDHRGFFPHEELRLGRPLATRGAGDQRHLAHQSCHLLASTPS